MKRAFYAAMGLSLLLGTSVLASCGGNTAEETPESESVSAEETEVSTPEADTADTPTSPEAEDSATATNETPINPPQAAVLTAQDTESQINLRSLPTIDSTSKGYGLVGDPVKLLRAARGEDGLTWYFVTFDESGAEGWVRGDFIDTSGTASRPSPEAEASISVDNFSRDELFAAGGGGCGMTLWPQGSNSSFIFFNGIEEASTWMKINGDLTQFRRTAASGESFYGQATNQSFVSLDGGSRINVTVTPGSEVDYEVMNIDGGTVQLDSGGEIVEIAVEGDAGC